MSNALLKSRGLNCFGCLFSSCGLCCISEKHRRALEDTEKLSEQVKEYNFFPHFGNFLHYTHLGITCRIQNKRKVFDTESCVSREAVESLK